MTDDRDMKKCILCGFKIYIASYEAEPVGICGACCKLPDHMPGCQYMPYLNKLSEKVRNKK